MEIPRYRDIILYISAFLIILWHNNTTIINLRIKELLNNINNHNDFEGDPKWVKVPNFKIQGSPEGHGELYVFSAYFDINMTVVRIIATTPNIAEDIIITCHFLGEREDHLLSSESGIVRALNNHAELPYKGGFVLCPLGPLEESQVYSVSLSNGTEGQNLRSIPLKITRMQKTSKPKHQFGLCLQPVSNYDNLFLFIQWLEFHKMMGVTHFTFYNISMGPKVSCALKTLLPSSSLTLLNGWGSAPMISNASLFYLHAQLIQVAECNYRYRGRARYYLSVDLDEYLVPNFTVAKDYKELWKFVGNETLPISQYIFKHAYFVPMKMDNKYERFSSSSPVEVQDLLLHSHIQRKKDMDPYGERSKFIADPYGISEPGVHVYTTLVPGYNAYNVPVDLAYLHHYRNWIAPHNMNATRAVDKNGRTVTDQLLRRVRKSMRLVENECN